MVGRGVRGQARRTCIVVAVVVFVVDVVEYRLDSGDSPEVVDTGRSFGSLRTGITNKGSQTHHASDACGPLCAVQNIAQGYS